MLQLYEEIEKPLLSVLFDMEEAGVKVSVDMLDELSARFDSLANEYKIRFMKNAAANSILIRPLSSAKCCTANLA